MAAHALRQHQIEERVLFLRADVGHKGQRDAGDHMLLSRMV
jgi:hypothetical protein